MGWAEHTCVRSMTELFISNVPGGIDRWKSRCLLLYDNQAQPTDDTASVDS